MRQKRKNEKLREKVMQAPDAVSLKICRGGGEKKQMRTKQKQSV